MYLLHSADLLHTWEHTEFPLPFIYLFIWLCFTLHFTSFWEGGKDLNLSGSKGKGASHVVRLVLHDINRKNALETIWIVWNK